MRRTTNVSCRLSTTLALAMLCLMSGCYRTVLTTPAARSDLEGDATGVSWVSLTPVTHNASECTKGVARVESQMPVWGALVWFITGGLIAPMTVEYRCSAGVRRPDAASGQEVAP